MVLAMTILQSVEVLAAEFPEFSFCADEQVWAFRTGDRRLKRRIAAVPVNNKILTSAASTFKTAVSIMQHILRPLEVVEMEK